MALMTTAALALHFRCERRHVGPEMLGEQTVAERGDGGLHARFAARLDRDVALGVEAHRAVAEIRRTHAGELVVDDDHFAVHVEDVGQFEAGHVRVQKTIAVVRVGFLQALVKPCAQHAHGAFLEPAFLRSARDHHDLGCVGRAQPCGERAADEARAEILILEVERLARRRDRVDVEVTDFFRGHARDVPGSVRAIATSMCVRSGSTPRGHGSWLHAIRGTHLLPRCALPAVAAKIAERARRGAVHDGLNVVIRPVGRAVGVAAPGLLAAVRGRVPAAMREIEAADEAHFVVHDNDFLMMRCAERMSVVETELEPPVRAPAELVDRQPLAVEREHHREVPGKHVHAQAALAFHDFVQEIAERFRQSVVRALRHEVDAAVDVPSEYVDAALRAGDRAA